MNENNMTLREFIEFADVYPYTQDHYVMEKMFMEMELMKMHLDSYEFLLNESSVSLDQLSVMMVESGINDQSYFTEQLFMEKGLNIFNGIKKMFMMIGKAITALFRKVRDAFSGGNKKIEELEKRNQEQIKLLEDLKLINDVSGVGRNARETVSEAQHAAERSKEQIDHIIDHIDRFVGGGGPKVVPVVSGNDNNSLKVIIDTTLKMAGNVEVSSASLAMYLTFMKAEYEVEGMAFIENLETLTEKISSVIDLSHDMDDRADVAYQSAKKLHRLGSKYAEAASTVRDEIEASCKLNKRFKLSPETTQKKMDTAVKLNGVFSKLAEWTDIGVVNKSNVVKNLVGRVLMNDDNQGVASDRADNHAHVAIKSDPEMKGKLRSLSVGSTRTVAANSIDKSKFLAQYSIYLKTINELAVTLQAATSETAKILSEHIKLRAEVIKTHSEISDGIDKIIEETKKAA